jgi:hypothetical protein
MILRRLPGLRFSEVLPAWAGKTVVLLGAGPSLTMEQVRTAQAAHAQGLLHCIAVNDTYLVAAWADAHYAADAHWHRWHTEGVPKPVLGLSAEQVREMWAAFPGQKCTIQNSGATVADDAVHMLRNRDFPNNGVGLSTDPQVLVTGRNSGFQALNLAVLAGAKKIILLGFDGQPAANGATHFSGGHSRPTPPAAYPLYRQAMSAAEYALADLGVTVVNCSPGSAIDSFPKMALEAAL